MIEQSKFPLLVWRDLAGFYTAVLADAEGVVELNEPVCGYAPRRQDAIAQVRECLSWYYREFEWAEPPSWTRCTLSSYKVKVRPEYRIGEKIYPYDRSLQMHLQVVNCHYGSGLCSAVIPNLGIEFFYSQGQLRDLVRHYTVQAVSGLTPREVGRHLRLLEPELEIVKMKLKRRKMARPQAGASELETVAEALTGRDFRQRFSPPYGRENELKELVKRIEDRSSNVLLLGKSSSGKTSLLVEAARKIEKKSSEEKTGPRHWMSSGAAVIAGMKYLGQWEERFEKVLAEVASMGGVLCFHSLLDLVTTGGSSPQSSIAAFLAPYLERGEVVSVVESTAEELEFCRRQFPAIVDLFSVLRLPDFEREDALSVLDKVASQCAQKFRTPYASQALSEIYRLHKRFVPYSGFPGKASSFLLQLYEEQSREGKGLDTPAVVSKFVRESGLPDKILRDDIKVPQKEISRYLSDRVLGQEEASQAVSSLVTKFKAGLNDPERPIGVLLFCGPTGVGKTEMCKGLASYLFSHGEKDERIIRLDMSEYSAWGAAARLVGTKDRPGEMVKKIRRQPFSVVLLDEIEKAHPEVFDMLLGVFDEGRLTDSWGRTANFRSSILIMTSNLGVSSLRPVGLRRQRETQSYDSQLMKFFRPEFFNRIDQVVPFEPLDQECIAKITEIQLRALGQREGLTNRALTLAWSSEVVEFLAHKGYDVNYGARPLKRAVESEVQVPLSRLLVDSPELENGTVELVLEGDRVTAVFR